MGAEAKTRPALETASSETVTILHMQRSEGWLHSAAGGDLVMVSEKRGSVSEK